MLTPSSKLFPYSMIFSGDVLVTWRYCRGCGLLGHGFSRAGMEGFRAKYHIPQGVSLQYCAPSQWLTQRREREVVIPMIAFIERRITLPMGRVTRYYLIAHSVDALNEQMGLNLTWHDVIWTYKCHLLVDLGYYLKSRSSVARLISCLSKSNKGIVARLVSCLSKSNKGIVARLPNSLGHVALNLNFVNVVGLNKVLRSEVFVSEDRQLRVVHLILDFKPLSNKFQDVGHAIRAGDPRLRRIDVSVPGFLAREDIVQVDLPACRSPHEAAVLREETASLQLSLEAEIDQLRLKDGERSKKSSLFRSWTPKMSPIDFQVFALRISLSHV
ncbi:hypothetical protein SO802_026206 [Lithocarpus litseifolius]|uniref:Uncharacterized protein n=1 Tax=Lithocarpus litseifolius TaxID=425828 RepID=A0AAW2BZ75_9ROSI